MSDGLSSTGDDWERKSDIPIPAAGDLRITLKDVESFLNSHGLVTEGTRIYRVSFGLSEVEIERLVIRDGKPVLNSDHDNILTFIETWTYEELAEQL